MTIRVIIGGEPKLEWNLAPVLKINQQTYKLIWKLYEESPKGIIAAGTILK